MEAWEARNTRYEAAWQYANSPDVFSKQSALDLVSSNLETLLGLDSASVKAVDKSWVAYEGDMFGFGGRVRAVRSQSADLVDLF